MKTSILIVIISLAFNTAFGDNWGFAHRLYGDTKARSVGDLLTVQIVEASSSSRQADLQTEKKTSMRGSMSFFHPKVDNIRTPWTNAVVPEWSVGTERDYQGSGQMKNEDSITATITVRVTEVLPNGNLLVEGRRSLSIQGEDVGYVLTGTVRPFDITRDNIIKSTKIADLDIQYYGTGAIARNQQKGLFNRLWDWVNPF